MAESEVHNSELSPDGAGARLRRAREAAGLSLADIAARTKIAERHLASIEQGRFGDLASSTYAVGFARAYARAVDLDEIAMAQAVRAELATRDDVRPGPKADVFEPGDPARVPGSRLAWVAGLAALAVIVLVFVFWRSYFSPAVTLPELVAVQPPSAAPSSGVPAVPPPAAAGQAVVFTALEPGVWVKFYDAAGRQLMQKQMAKGESYTVPAGADGPMLRTARPDALQIAVGGRIVPRLSEKSETVSDVPVSAAALLARAAPTASRAAVPSPSAAASPSPAVSRTSAEPQAQAAPTARPTAMPSPRPRATPTGRATAAPSPSPAPASPAASPTPAAAPTPAPAETSTVSN